MPKKQPSQVRTWLTLGGLATAAYVLLKPTPKASLLGQLHGGFLPTVTPKEIMGTLERIGRDLGNHLANAARLTAVPSWLMQAIIAHEIRFSKYSTVNPAVGATGPGQITPPTLFDTYYMASQWGILTPGIDNVFRQKLGSSYTRFRALALQRQADTALGRRVLLDAEFNVVVAGLLLSCLTRLFHDGTMADRGRVVLGYNRGIDWSLKAVAKAMKFKSTAALIKAVGQPTWRFPSYLMVEPQRLQSSVESKEAKAYLADHLAQGGYFDYVVRLGLTSDSSL